nr:MAG TPA_asm: endonuclease-like protein [Caudoviricetes sp.]
MEIYEFLNGSYFDQNKENLFEINNCLISHKNYSEKAWKNKNTNIYQRIQGIAEEFKLSWKDCRRLITQAFEIRNSFLYQKYLLLKENSSFENCKEFEKLLKIHKVSENSISEKYPFFKKILEEIMDPQCNSLEERVYLLSNNRLTLNYCPLCHSVIHIIKGYEAKTCDKKECRNLQVSLTHKNTPEEIQKQTLEKRRKTCIEKYGVDNPNKCKIVRDKIMQTSIERYGVPYTTQAQEAKEKKRKTFFEKYGNEVATKSEVVKEKARKTCIEKYGVDNIKKSDWIKNYFFEKYGVESSNLIGKDLEKVKIVKDFSLFKKYLEDHSSFTLVQIGEDLGFSPYFIRHLVHEYNLEEVMNIKSSCSNGELSLQNFIKEILPYEKIIFHDRTQIYPYELDIYIPDKNIAIEYNGNFWHSDYSVRIEEAHNAKTRHLYKTNKCKEKGIRLIHIFEYEWTDIEKNPRVKNFLENILCTKKKINAQECEIKKIDFPLSKIFFDENHLRGSVNAKISIGLFYKGELRACMSFSKPRFSSKYDWELMRFSVKKGFYIEGGAKKLLEFFREKYEGSIIAYVDISKMSEDLYKILGFTELKSSKPNYVWSKGSQILTRFETQKSKLLKEGYVGSTENEIMRKRGFSKLYDCGNYVFEMSHLNEKVTSIVETIKV